MKEVHCDKCDEVLTTPGSECVDISACRDRQLTTALQENDKLKTSVKEWKDSWFQLREGIKWLWWDHPAIASDEQRAYYQRQQATRIK